MESAICHHILRCAYTANQAVTYGVWRPVLAHRWRIHQVRVRLLRPYISVLLPTELPMALSTKMLLTVLLKVGIFERNREQVSVVWLAHLAVTI